MLNPDILLRISRWVMRTRLTPQQALAAMNRGAILLDVRYTEQLERDGVIEGAIRGNLNEIVWRFDPRERAWRDRRIPVGRKVRILVICNQGYCSSIAAAALVLMGYKATDVAGGYQAWIAEGLPRRPYDAVRDVY